MGKLTSAGKQLYLYLLWILVILLGLAAFAPPRQLDEIMEFIRSLKARAF